MNDCGPRPVVLVADDDMALRLTVGSALQKSGFEVVEAEDGREAVEKFVETRPDLVLLDIMMPRLDGYSALQEMRQQPRRHQVPVVMITSLDDEESINQAYDAGATDFVTKPINYQILARRLQYLLRANRLLVRFDPLTGLPTREVFLEALEHAIDLAKRHDRVLGVLFIDVNNFRHVNNSFGHRAGDSVLCDLAGRLQTDVRGTDRIARDLIELTHTSQWGMEGIAVARLGGDEFVVFLDDVRDVAVVSTVVRRLSTLLAAPFHVDAEPLYITTNIGISVYPVDGDDAESLVRFAEVASHHIKSHKRNGFQFYRESLNVQSKKRFSLESALRRAMEREEFEVHFQPRVSLRNRQTVSLEALIRWTNPDVGSVPPSEFIGIAEETGLIVPLGNWTLETACGEIERWRGLGYPHLGASVNLSPLQFRDRAALEGIVEILKRSHTPSGALEIELTEGTLMEDTERSVGILETFRDLGLQIAIDDFGTGYSSLAYLKRFPVTGLKIDQSFVRNLTTDDDAATIVNAIISLGHNLGLKTTAEGVEEHDQLTFLRAYGCDEVQGYLISRPMPPDEVPAWLSSWSAAEMQFGPAGDNRPSASAASSSVPMLGNGRWKIA